jgi:c-di-GMP-binding flagellar brake protein YcgR
MGIEQRKAKRVDVNAIISINRLNNGEFFHREDEEKFNVSIIDISETGLAFATDRPIEINSYYNTDLDFDGCERIKAVVQIVRKDVQESGRSVYGGRFIGISTEDQFRLSVFRIVSENKAEKTK